MRPTPCLISSLHCQPFCMVKPMKALDELKESIASLDKALAKGMPIRPAVEMVLVSDCLTGIVKVLEALASQPEKQVSTDNLAFGD